MTTTKTKFAERQVVRRLSARYSSGLTEVGWSVVSLLLLGGVWQAVGVAANFSFLPPFSEVVERLWQLLHESLIYESLGKSLTDLAIGLVISVVLGTVIGVLMAASRKAEAALDLYVNILLTTPKLVFAPVLFALFGVGRAVLIILVVLFSLVYIIVNTADGMRAVSGSLLEMARAFNANGWQTLVKIIVPAAVPMIMAGFLIAIPRAVKGMIVGEMFLAAVGLGAIVVSAGKQFDATTVLAMLILIVALAFALLGLFRLFERRVQVWLPTPASDG